MLAGASVTSEWFHSGSLAFGGVADSSARARGGEGVGSKCLESTSLLVALEAHRGSRSTSS